MQAVSVQSRTQEPPQPRQIVSSSSESYSNAGSAARLAPVLADVE